MAATRTKHVPKIIPQLATEEMQIGFGAAHSKMSCGEIVSHFKGRICVEATTPIYFTSSRYYPGPLTQADLEQGLGDSIDLFDPDPPGVSSVFQTAGMKDGEFQQNLLIMGIGIHGFAPEHSWTARGNAFLTSAFPSPGAGVAPSFSPSEYTVKDATATSGAWGTNQVPTAPAWLNLGEWVNLGFHYWALGSQLVWSMGNQLTLLHDSLRHTLHMPQNPMDGSAGLSQANIMEAAAGCNAYYRSIGSTLLFVPIDTVRVGSVGAGAANIGIFGPSNDFQFVDQLWGGGTVRNLRCNPETRKLENPVHLPRGINVGIRINSVEQTLQSYYQSAWAANFNSGSAAVPLAITSDAAFLPSGTSSYTERSVDSNNVAESNPSTRVGFKMGPWQIDALLHAWEIHPSISAAIEADPAIAGKLAAECGVRCA